jgi:chromosome segregation ATPase
MKENMKDYDKRLDEAAKKYADIEKRMKEATNEKEHYKKRYNEYKYRLEKHNHTSVGSHNHV